MSEVNAIPFAVVIKTCIQDNEVQVVFQLVLIFEKLGVKTEKFGAQVFEVLWRVFCGEDLVL